MNIEGKVQFLGEEHRCAVDCRVPTAWLRAPACKLYILDPAYERKRQQISLESARSGKRFCLLHPGDTSTVNEVIDLTSSDDELSNITEEEEVEEEIDIDVDTTTLLTSDVSYLFTQSSSVYEGTRRSIHWEWLSEDEDSTVEQEEVNSLVSFREVHADTIFSGTTSFAQYRAQFWDDVAREATTTGLGKIWLSCIYQELRRTVDLELFYNSASFTRAFAEYISSSDLEIQPFHQQESQEEEEEEDITIHI